MSAYHSIVETISRAPQPSTGFVPRASSRRAVYLGVMTKFRTMTIIARRLGLLPRRRCRRGARHHHSPNGGRTHAAYATHAPAADPCVWQVPASPHYADAMLRCQPSVRETDGWHRNISHCNITVDISIHRLRTWYECTGLQTPPASSRPLPNSCLVC